MVEVTDTVPYVGGLSSPQSITVVTYHRVLPTDTGNLFTYHASLVMRLRSTVCKA